MNLAWKVSSEASSVCHSPLSLETVSIRIEQMHGRLHWQKVKKTEARTRWHTVTMKNNLHHVHHWLHAFPSQPTAHPGAVKARRDVSCQRACFGSDGPLCFLLGSLRPQAGNHPAHGHTQASQQSARMMDVLEWQKKLVFKI